MDAGSRCLFSVGTTAVTTHSPPLTAHFILRTRDGFESHVDEQRCSQRCSVQESVCLWDTSVPDHDEHCNKTGHLPFQRVNFASTAGLIPITHLSSFMNDD